MPDAGAVKIISDVSNNSLTVETVSFLPSSVVEAPRAPPKREVSGRHTVFGVAGLVKAAADAARPSTTIDDFTMM